MMASPNVNLIVAFIDLFSIVAMIMLILTELDDKKDKRILSFDGLRTMKYPALLIVIYAAIAIVSALTDGSQYF